MYNRSITQSDSKSKLEEGVQQGNNQIMEKSSNIQEENKGIKNSSDSSSQKIDTLNDSQAAIDFFKSKGPNLVEKNEKIAIINSSKQVQPTGQENASPGLKKRQSDFMNRSEQQMQNESIVYPAQLNDNNFSGTQKNTIAKGFAKLAARLVESDSGSDVPRHYKNTESSIIINPANHTTRKKVEKFDTGMLTDDLYHYNANK